MVKLFLIICLVCFVAFSSASLVEEPSRDKTELLNFCIHLTGVI